MVCTGFHVDIRACRYSETLTHTVPLEINSRTAIYDNTGALCSYVCTIGHTHVVL